MTRRDKQGERIADGERRRDAGMSRAASRRPDRVTAGRLALAVALLESLNGCATIDNATPPGELAEGYSDGGRWRGTVVRSMVADGLVEVVGTARSTRPSRHRGYIARLRAKDRNALRAFVERLAAFQFQDETTPPAATGGVAMTDTNNTPLGGNEHGESK
jgi:hypothetical protein